MITNFVTYKELTIHSSPLYARIRYGEKWYTRAKKRTCKKENGGLVFKRPIKNLNSKILYSPLPPSFFVERLRRLRGAKRPTGTTMIAHKSSIVYIYFITCEYCSLLIFYYLQILYSLQIFYT